MNPHNLYQVLQQKKKKKGNKIFTHQQLPGEKARHILSYPGTKINQWKGGGAGTPNGAKAPGGYSPVPHNPACTMVVDKTATAARNTLFTAGNGTRFD